MKNLLGGWQVSGASFFRSGTPFSITRGNDIAGVGGGDGSRVDLVGDINANANGQFSEGAGNDTNFIFNPAAFANPAAGRFGNADPQSSSATRAISSGTWRSSRTSISVDRRELQFRVEMFNFINHPNLSGPNTRHHQREFRPSRSRRMETGATFSSRCATCSRPRITRITRIVRHDAGRGHTPSGVFLYPCCPVSVALRSDLAVLSTAGPPALLRKGRVEWPNVVPAGAVSDHRGESDHPAAQNASQDTHQKMTRSRFSELSQGTRLLMWSVLGFGALLGADRVAARVQTTGVSFSFKNIATEAGLVAKTIYGGLDTNQYLLETTGTGAAAFDYDGDGWIDIFLVNGTTLEGFPAGKEPTNHLYRNKGNGTFEDVTTRAGLAQGGWGQGVCAGDYDNDGHDDLFVTYWGQNRLYRNKGDGAFEDTTARAGLTQPRTRWGAGCAFLDYNRDGLLDIVAANYIDLDLKATPLPSSGLCRYKGLPVACGPPGLPGGKNVLYRNRGNGAFEDVSDASGIAAARGTYGLGVATVDFDNDGWLDVYVANDSNPSALYHNNRNGTFTDIGIAAGCAYSQDGKPQAGMGVAIGDYDRNGTLDIFKTNFAGDTSTLYANTGKGACEDRTFAGGIGLNTRWLGWGVGFVDLDNDGWLDLFLVNGHVYPEVDRLKTEAGYKQRKVVYRNLKNGRFADVTEQLGPPVTIPKAGRGAAFADFDNDGDVDVVINNVHDTPDLYRLDQTGDRHWLAVKLVGAESNRSAIGARVQLVTADGVQVQEVRGGGSYYSQSDFRLHFGLGSATAIDRLEVRWPNGREETWTALAIDKSHTLKEGSGTGRKAP